MTLKSELLPQARRLLIVTFVSLLVQLVAFGQAESGQISGIVTDQNGGLVPGASIVVKNDRTGEERTATSSDEGTYTVSSAMTVSNNGYNDRMASPEAHVQVIPQDTTSLVLTLHPIETPIEELSAATLKKIGVADEIAKYTN